MGLKHDLLWNMILTPRTGVGASSNRARLDGLHALFDRLELVEDAPPPTPDDDTMRRAHEHAATESRAAIADAAIARYRENSTDRALAKLRCASCGWTWPDLCNYHKSLDAKRSERKSTSAACRGRRRKAEEKMSGFSFTPPGAAQFAPQNNPATPAGPNVGQQLNQAFAPPPADIAAQIAESLQGMHDAGERHPDLPTPFQFHLKINELRAHPGFHGLAFFVDCYVLRSNCPSPIPSDMLFSGKISGFKNQKAKHFAFSDLKALMRAIAPVIEAKGTPGQAPWLSVGWNGTDQEWIKLVADVVRSGVATGAEVFAQTALLQTQNKPLVKIAWAPATGVK